VLGRVHRAGGKSNTQQHVCSPLATVEVQVEKAVRRGMERIGIFNDGLKNDYGDGNPVIIAPPRRKLLFGSDHNPQHWLVRKK